MPRDYKSRASTTKKHKPQTPGWVWFLGGLVTGFFVSGLVWLKMSPVANLPSAGKAQVEQKRAVKAEPEKKIPEKKEPEAPKPRFDFYTILPEMEVVVPEPEEQPQTTPDGAAPVVDTASPSIGSYMLQMGSFRKYADADRLKASLALVGIEAEIQKVTVNNGEIFHRVRSGPYTRDQANTLRNRLKENRISSLIIRMKG
jgi:cell division protein FtsN